MTAGDAPTVERDARTVERSAPIGWVPVDQRWLGLDRRTIAPAVVVLVLAVVMIFLIPAIDSAVPAGRAIPPGSKVGLSGDVEFTPSSGWTLVDGAVIGDTTRSGGYPATAEVVQGAASLSVTTAKFQGTAEQLLTQIESTAERAGTRSQFSGDPRTVRTDSGVSGVQTEVRTTTSAGLVVAFVIDGYGIEVSVNAPRQPGRNVTADVQAMVTSIASMGDRS